MTIHALKLLELDAVDDEPELLTGFEPQAAARPTAASAAVILMAFFTKAS
ncbi:MAG TPA: hypothetical protein VGZ32_01120 [Actinocrinis sp.]|nr:hypothetical protein [Actinocrinis sp.]HEV3168904.1 hypothetical protein [Actinocrinis sp.]